MATMNAWEPLESDDAAGPPGVFTVRRAGPPDAPPPTPLVFASPHSGRHYPDDMMSATALDARAIRQSEDAFVDDLLQEAPALGAALITAGYARAYIDLNRDAFELDAAMFSDELPEYAKGRTARVAAGLGAIARVVSEGQEIYDRKLTFAEARARIDGAHRPYHTALDQLLVETRQAHGLAILIDWHSMPAAAATSGSRDRPFDMVLGDRFGASCNGLLISRVERALHAMGYRVARNTPYAGGYTTEHYGRPSQRIHALQIEINRALYLNEVTLAPTAHFATLQANIEALTRSLAAADWTPLRATSGSI